LTPAPQVNWATLERIRAMWPGQAGDQGILHPDDALRAVEAGVNALIVSNHGGRQLDTAPSPLEMLPAIRDAVGDRAELIYDSGIRRGTDVIIAMCLGVRLCLFGRPPLYGRGRCRNARRHARHRHPVEGDRHHHDADRMRQARPARAAHAAAARRTNASAPDYRPAIAGRPAIDG
jgi:hypothetical protein